MRDLSTNLPRVKLSPLSSFPLTICYLNEIGFARITRKRGSLPPLLGFVVAPWKSTLEIERGRRVNSQDEVPFKTRGLTHFVNIRRVLRELLSRRCLSIGINKKNNNTSTTMMTRATSIHPTSEFLPDTYDTSDSFLVSIDFNRRENVALYRSFDLDMMSTTTVSWFFIQKGFRQLISDN